MAKRVGGPLFGPPIPDAPGPSRPLMRYMEIVRPLHERPVEVTLVSLRWRAMNVHWVPALKRTLPCPGAGCEHCQEIGVAWYAWCVAVCHRSTRLIIVEATERAWEWGPNDVCDLDSVVRGKGVRLRRKTRSPTGPVLIDSIEPKWGESQIPPPMDPKPLLLRLWGYTEANPMTSNPSVNPQG